MDPDQTALSSLIRVYTVEETSKTFQQTNIVVIGALRVKNEKKTAKKIMFNVRIQEFSSGGGPGQIDQKKLWQPSLFSPQLILQKSNGQFIFQGSRGGPIFSRGGGPTFSRGGGGPVAYSL